MTLRYVLGATLFFMYCGAARGQGVYALAQGGVALGSPQSGAVGEVAAGVRLRNWQLGVSSGIDNAGATGIPLLADVRWTFWHGKTSLGLFSQQGWNFITCKKERLYPPVYTRTTYQISPPYQPYTEYMTGYGGGAYWAGGVFWRIPVKRAGGLLLSAGPGYRDYRSLDYYETTSNSSPAGHTTIAHQKWRGVVMVGWEW